MDITAKKVLNFQEACQYTGFRASYLYKLTSTGRIPHHKPYGKIIFFNREELEDFLTGKAEGRKIVARARR